MPEPGRTVTMELDLEATLEDAWKALTDARELTRWFPLTALVEGRQGGAMVWDWGERFHWASRIDVWEPPRRLRLIQEMERPRDVEGNPVADGTIASSLMAMDFTLETQQGKTRLRLVHSGFGEGAAWDDELDGVRNGWAFELRSLAHYLAHHRGNDRHYGWGMASADGPHAAVWQRLLGPGGYQLEGTLSAGKRFTVRTPTGDRLTGMVLLHNPEREFAGTVEELDGGVFRLGTWSGGGAVGINVWIATWSPAHADRVTGLGSSAQDFLNRTFGTVSTAR